MIDPVITPEQLASILQREYDNADSYYEQLEELQTLAFDYYEAKPMGNEIDGRSQVVLPDVQTAIDHMTQSILRTFVSGDRVVEFEAEDDGDDQSTGDATAAVDYYLMRKQDGYRMLYDVLNDGLLRKTGVFKAVAEKRERVTREEVIVAVEALGMLPDNVEVEDAVDNGDGTATASLKATTVETCYTGHAVPLHEFRFQPRAKHEDTAVYVCHVCPITRGELVEMGFDREQVYGLPRFNDNDLEHYESDKLDFYDNEETSPAVELVELCEEYARVDVDGDGIAERVKVFRVGGEILRYQGEPVIDPETGEQAQDERGEPLFDEGELSVEQVDFQPFSVFTPFPRPHKIVGYSLADKVMDIQYLRTMLARQMIDGMAFSNLPRLLVSEAGSSDQTLDDVLSPIPGAPIRVRDPGAVVSLGSSFNVGQSLTVMEWATGEGEKRTGITAMNQGLDADALNKTATGTALMQAAGQQMEEAIARQMAEAFGRLCNKIYRMMKDDADPFTIRVDGQPRQVDPSQWPDKMHVRTRVGLGTGSKDKRIQARMALYGPLTAAIEQGLAGAEHAFKWMDGVARDTGIGRGDDFMFNPEDPEVQARMAQQGEAPDPELVKVQEEMGLKREQAAFDAEMRVFEMERRMELEGAKIAGTLDLAAFKAETEAQLAVMKANLEARLKVDMSENRSGGDLDK
jgi:hypothetical protein